MARHFSIEEANALLPRVRSIMESILATRQRIIDAQPEVQPIFESAAGNGGSKKAGELVEDFKKLERGIEAIQELDIIVKDVNSGLVDFPALREGREVFLCWRYDEPDVSFWHDLHTGFDGRKPIDWE